MAAGALAQTPPPAPAAPPAPLVARANPGVEPALFDVLAENADARELLDQLAASSGLSLSYAGPPTGPASVQIHAQPAATALSLIAASAGLLVRRMDGGWVVSPPGLPPALDSSGFVTPVYSCAHITATSLQATLQAVFDPARLKVAMGPSYLSPDLASPQTSSYSTTTGGDTAGSITPLATLDASLRTHDLVLSGDPATVEQALALARQMDLPRGQVRVKVTITDISLDALRQLGVQWDFGGFGVQELDELANKVDLLPDLSFGKFARTPLQISAAIQALERSGHAKLLAEPTVSLLDGERAFILIGDKILYPHLVTSYYGQPTYDTLEARVGVYIQLGARISEQEVVLSVYPQVSTVTDFLEVNNSRYPQISTREEQTTIRVRQGDVVVIGGLIREDEIKQLQRVPLLGRIPLLGELFKYRERTKLRTELVVMISAELLLASASPEAPLPAPTR
jgi:type II secretory pathway component GspD/PulD (secretin)